MLKTALFVATAAVTTLAAASPVLASEVAVRYKDLDLATPAGQSKLARRLDVAAREACGYDETITGTRLPARSTVECYRQAQVRARNAMATILGDIQRGG